MYSPDKMMNGKPALHPPISAPSSCFPGRYSPTYRSPDPMRRCMPNPSVSARGGAGFGHETAGDQACEFRFMDVWTDQEMWCQSCISFVKPNISVTIYNVNYKKRKQLTYSKYSLPAKDNFVHRLNVHVCQFLCLIYKHLQN
ncbi:hypothetical protein R5R35_006293 [Gryllus longicercus]|uniref:Uncharacterized protein n=1 Tax=Gryllus longicercus TaxID=2509291 RepID=A0AAN9ZA78_9ORTH